MDQLLKKPGFAELAWEVKKLMMLSGILEKLSIMSKKTQRKTPTIGLVDICAKERLSVTSLFLMLDISFLTLTITMKQRLRCSRTSLRIKLLLATPPMLLMETHAR
jgi:hypothetical protein